MPMHLGTTLGLVTAGVLTTLKLLQAKREGWGMGDTLQGCVTGYSFADENFNAERMTITLPIVIGGGITYVAKKTHYNDDTPKGVNL